MCDLLPSPVKKKTEILFTKLSINVAKMQKLYVPCLTLKSKIITY